MQLRILVAIALAAASALGLAPTAAAAQMYYGAYNVAIDGRYDFHTWIFSISACNDTVPDCVSVITIPQPVAKAYEAYVNAYYADGKYTMVVDDPFGLRCGNVYYGPTIPTRDVYTWDAKTLVGSMASSFANGCDGAPGGTFTYPIRLSRM
ncbi:hypothetical protein [Mycolicibacterium mengxianglii]|uniref:hypothetical protein n=1 Tax=Mycolicibacterium mengxianglii TaxID=2736649 RepID=UPI0018D1443B